MSSRLCLKDPSGFKRPFFRLAAFGSIDDTTSIACFAIFTRHEKLLAPGSATELSERA
ncbi:MAG: hypothetical protein IIA65_08565 [Planctomycetes bacterium]|nr:hypothetical protein [Planctomycetota bacterium]